MAKKVYQQYLDQIRSAINEPNYLNNKIVNLSSKADSGTQNFLLENVNDLSVETGLTSLTELLGKRGPIKVSAGDHPDFAYLRHSKEVKCQHYIVSVFVDVKNSTNFFRKYSHDQIAMIIQTIQSAAIHTCSLFDGHIQRQQYDGLFLYFGGKNKSKAEAIDDALKAVAFFTYFIKYELPEIFDANELDKIYTRAGIDFGDDDEVSWYVFGVNGCSELTTVSLHTSLAPKMQSYAKHNGVVIGENLTDKVPGLNQYTTTPYDGDEQVPLIFKNPNYKQFDFDWQRYLADSFNFVKRFGDKIEIDYEHESQNITSFDRKIDMLKNNQAAISTGGILGSTGHVISSNKFYGWV